MPRGEAVNPNSNRQRVLRYLIQHPAADNAEIGNALALHRNTVSKVRSELKVQGKLYFLDQETGQIQESVAAGATQETQPGLSPEPDEYAGLEGFQRLYDKSHIIRDKIDTELKRRGWYYDDDFRVICMMSINDWKRLRGDFAHLQVQLPDKRLAWGHPEIIDKMRETILR